MGLITKELWIHGPKGRRKVTVLFDSGSTYSLIHRRVADAVGTPVELAEPKRFQAAVGEFTAQTGLFVDVGLGRRRLGASPYVADELTEDFIIGCDFLQLWHIRLDPRRRRVLLDPKALKLKAVGSRLISKD